MKSQCEICKDEVEGSLYVYTLKSVRKKMCENCVRRKIHNMNLADIKLQQDANRRNRKDRRAESE